MTFALVKEFVSGGEAENVIAHFFILVKNKYKEYENDYSFYRENSKISRSAP